MAHINETINLNRNEGLDIDINRIVYKEDTGAVVDIRPNWMKVQVSANEIEKHLPKSVCGDIVIIREDELEILLKALLSKQVNSEVASFRWVWDKFRDYKAA